MTTDTDEVLRAKIRKELRIRKISFRQLAKRMTELGCQTSPQTPYWMLNEKKPRTITARELKFIATILEMSVDELMTSEEPDYIPVHIDDLAPEELKTYAESLFAELRNRNDEFGEYWENIAKNLAPAFLRVEKMRVERWRAEIDKKKTEPVITIAS